VAKNTIILELQVLKISEKLKHLSCLLSSRITCSRFIEASISARKGYPGLEPFHRYPVNIPVMGNTHCIDFAVMLIRNQIVV